MKSHETLISNFEVWAFGEEGSLNKKAAFSQTMLWQSCIRKGGREAGKEGYNGIIKILIYVQVREILLIGMLVVR